MTMTYLQYLINKKKLSQQKEDLVETLSKELSSIKTNTKGVKPNSGTEGDLAFTLASQYLPAMQENELARRQLEQTYKSGVDEQHSNFARGVIKTVHSFINKILPF